MRGVQLPTRRIRVDDRFKRWVLEELAQDAGRSPQKLEDVKSDWPAIIPPF